MTQQELIRSAKKHMEMTTEQLAKHLKINKHRLSNWLLPDTSKRYSPMEDIFYSYIQSVMEKW